MNIITLNDYFLNSNNNKNIGKIYRQVATACKIISSGINRAYIDGLSGNTETSNVHGEVIKKLDNYSNNIFLSCLEKVKDIRAVISEEMTDIKRIHKDGNYVVAFDPLDGSSNIDCNVNVGSIISIYKYNGDDTLLLSGDNIVSSSYCMYGSATELVVAYNNQVNIFILDNKCGEFILRACNIKIPKLKNIYSFNEGNSNICSKKINELLDYLKSKNNSYSLRYIGSMVADIHRTLLYGGIFMYPATSKANNGKLRLMYEVVPMSFIIETAGGKALTKKNTGVINIKPNSIHERVPIFLGSSECMKIVNKFL